jgi:ketose-bisphosphate aldolase
VSFIFIQWYILFRFIKVILLPNSGDVNNFSKICCIYNINMLIYHKKWCIYIKLFEWDQVIGMALVSMKRLMKNAQENKYAVGYFESWNMESLLAVVDAAERMNSPVIIGFGGTFIGNHERVTKEDIYHYGSLGMTVAQRSKVPMALLMNESDQVPMLINALHAGFNAIMYQDVEASFDETIAINQYIVRTAHILGADVEAEVGELPNSDAMTGAICGGDKTDPEKAAYFVSQTGIDALAVAIGNVHLLESGKAGLDYDLIRRIHARVDIPLVMHGGTGIGDESIREAIDLGICKINVGTIMKRSFINYIRQYLTENDTDKLIAHEIIGLGGKRDMLAGARETVTQDVMRYIKIFRSNNKAGLL